MGVTLSDMKDFVACRCSEEKVEEILVDLEKADSLASQYLKWFVSTTEILRDFPWEKMVLDDSLSHDPGENSQYEDIGVGEANANELTPDADVTQVDRHSQLASNDSHAEPVEPASFNHDKQAINAVVSPAPEESDFTKKGNDATATLSFHGARWRRVATAACLLVGATGMAWGLWEVRVARTLRREAADRAVQLADARSQLAAVEKEAFLALKPSSVRSYWSATTTSQTLRLPSVRGPGLANPDALAHAERARSTLRQLAELPNCRGQALLELASLDIAADLREAALESLQAAEDLLGETPESANLRAVWHLAAGDRAATQRAESILRTVTRLHPDCLPARYNLALLLQRMFRDDESRREQGERIKKR